MGMNNVIIVEHTAKKLENIILKVMNNKRWNYVRSVVTGLVKENLVEWYYDECRETCGSYKPHKDILEMFPPQKKK